MIRPALRKRGVPDDLPFEYEPVIERQRIRKKYIVPIQDLKGYLWLMERHGATPEEIEIARRRNTPGDPLNCIIEMYTTTQKPKSFKPVKKAKRV